MIELEKAPNGWMCTTDPGEPGTGQKRWSINDYEGRLLAELFRGLDVLEIGTGLGVSTKAIAKSANRVYTVDIDPWVEKNIAPGLPENVSFYPSTESIPEVDAAFLDGRHTFDATKKDIDVAQKLVKKGGMMVFHDTNINGVLKAIMSRKLLGYLIETEAGMAVVWND